MKPDRREVTGLAANPVILPSDQKLLKHFFANSIEGYGDNPMGWSLIIRIVHAIPFNQYTSCNIQFAGGLHFVRFNLE